MIRFPIPMLVLLVAATASAAVMPPASPQIRRAHDGHPGGVLSHGNSPDDVDGHVDTPVSAPLAGPWALPWEVVTDSASPRRDAVEWLVDAGPPLERVGAAPLGAAPVPAPSGLVLIGLGAATLLGRRRRVR